MPISSYHDHACQFICSLLSFPDVIEKENPINQLRIGSLDLSQDVHKKFEILDVTYFVKSGIEVGNNVTFHILLMKK